MKDWRGFGRPTREWHEYIIGLDNCCLSGCGATGEVAHHIVLKTHLTKEERINPAFSMTLCLNCHNKAHETGGKAFIIGILMGLRLTPRKFRWTKAPEGSPASNLIEHLKNMRDLKGVGK